MIFSRCEDLVQDIMLSPERPHSVSRSGFRDEASLLAVTSAAEDGSREIDNMVNVRSLFRSIF